MKFYHRRAGALALLAALCASTGAARAAAQQPTRVNDDETRRIIRRVEQGSDTFRKSLRQALDETRFDDTKAEDDINAYVRRFEQASDRLRDRFDDDSTASGAASQVLERAMSIDAFMRRFPLTPKAQEDWSALRTSLNDLATAYSVTWDWGTGGGVVATRASNDDVKALLADIERNADRFRGSLKTALESSRLDGTNREDNINDFVKEFEQATDAWKSHFDDNDTASRDAAEVLRRAQRIDRFMRRHALTDAAQSDWSALRGNLDSLARAYNVTWSWDAAD